MLIVTERTLLVRLTAELGHVRRCGVALLVVGASAGVLVVLAVRQGHTYRWSWAIGAAVLLAVMFSALAVGSLVVVGSPGDLYD